MEKFKNDILAGAMANMRADNSRENTLKMTRALLDTKLLVPADWDQQPEVDENGQMHFRPDTKISLKVVTGKKGEQFFPMFTSFEEIEKFFKDTKINCLVLSMDQYVPFLEQGKGTIGGIVVDPAGASMPFPTEFIEGIRKANRTPLNQNTIPQGQKVLLRNPVGDIQNLEAMLISAGFHEPAVNAIYLKQRADDPEDESKFHWFIVVDSEELDTGIFTRIAEKIKPVCQKKDLEFLFTNQKLGKDVASTTKPLYERTVN